MSLRGWCAVAMAVVVCGELGFSGRFAYVACGGGLAEAGACFGDVIVRN